MKKVLSVLALSCVLVFGANDANSTKESNTTVAAQQVPKFAFEDTAGSKIEVTQTNDGLKYSFGDKNVILFFYLYDGAPCQGQLETFKEFIKDKKDLEIVTVELKGLDKEGLAKYAKEKNLNFHMVTGKSAGEFVNYIAYRAKWQGTVPFIIITNKASAVKHIQIGAMNKEQLQNAYDKLN